jgi:dihydrofolate reductase
VVVSTTLDQAKWQNSTLIGGNVAEEISQLKQRPGRNINMSGSGTLVTWLLREGLLDQLDLLLFPVVVGHGKRLFEGECGQAGLKLAASETFSTGVVHLTYQRADG